MIIPPGIDLYDDVAARPNVLGKTLQKESLSAAPIGIEVYYIRAFALPLLSLPVLADQEIV